jgi:NAD(P)-dependent dehydrogenase (short-subunit alcohol dehydrogenase family)
LTLNSANRVVVISDAGQGIGRAFANSFASAGAIVVIAESLSGNIRFDCTVFGA